MSSSRAAKIIKNFHAYGKTHNLRITEPREHVFTILAKSKKPLTAYDILERLGEYLKDPAPPTVYRALEFLTENGFVHRIESLNAYFACEENHRHRGSQYLICDNCGEIEEIHLCDLPNELEAELSKHKNFTLSYWNVELHGNCSACRNA